MPRPIPAKSDTVHAIVATPHNARTIPDQKDADDAGATLWVRCVSLNTHRIPAGIRTTPIPGSIATDRNARQNIVKFLLRQIRLLTIKTQNFILRKTAKGAKKVEKEKAKIWLSDPNLNFRFLTPYRPLGDVFSLDGCLLMGDPLPPRGSRFAFGASLWTLWLCLV